MVIDCSKCPERGCCCGLIPFSKEFYEKHKSKIKVQPVEIKDAGEDIVAATENLRCIFQDPKTWRCAIYKDRPEVCRLFGTKEGINKKSLGIACPFFKPNGNPWSKAMRSRINHVAGKKVKRFRNYGKNPLIEPI